MKSRTLITPLAAAALLLAAPAGGAVSNGEKAAGTTGFPPKARLGPLPAGVVAVVQGENVTADEFGSLLAGAAIMAKGATPEGRAEVLRGEIQRRLLVRDALATGVDKQTVPAMMIARMQRRWLRDLTVQALGREVTVTEEEVASAFRDPGDLVTFTVLLAESREAAEAALARVRAKEDFSKVSAEVSIPPVSGVNLVRRDVARGETMYPPEVEEAIFRMAPDALSPPMETAVGFLVVKFVSRRRLTQAERDDALGQLRAKMMGERNAEKLEAAIGPRRKKAQVRILRERYAGPDIPDPVLVGWDLWLPLDSVKVGVVNGTTLTLGDIFLQELDFRVFQKKADPDKQLKALFERAVDDYLLYEEGLARGLDRVPGLEQRAQAYRDQLIATKRTYDIGQAVRKVDEKKARAYFGEHRAEYLSEPRLELRQILVRKEAEAKATVELLRKGTAFADLARKSSLHESARKGGMMGVMGQKALGREYGTEGAAKLFELARAKRLGPHQLRTTSGWHIVQIMKLLEPGEGSYEEVEEKVLNDSLLAIRREAVSAHLRKLEDAAEISIDVEKVRTTRLPEQAPSGHSPAGAMPGPSPHGGSRGGSPPRSPH